MIPDHEAATKWAEEMLRLNSVSPLGKIGNTAACYLDAMARLDKAEKERDGWKDAYFELIRAIGSTPGNSTSPAAIAHELMARLDKATELLRATSEWADSVNPAAQLAVDIRAFLAAERK